MKRQEAALSKACLVGAVAAVFGFGALTAQAQNQNQAASGELKSYESNSKNFWSNPPPDWFLGDETKAQKGQVPNPGQPTPTPAAELEKILAKIQVPPRRWARGSRESATRSPHHP